MQEVKGVQVEDEDAGKRVNDILDVLTIVDGIQEV